MNLENQYNPSDPDRRRSRGPTPDDLAGIPVLVEGNEDTTVRPAPAAVRRPATLPPATQRPTQEDLAGITVCVEQKSS